MIHVHIVLKKKKKVAGGYKISFVAPLMCSYNENSPQNQEHEEKLTVTVVIKCKAAAS